MLLPTPSPKTRPTPPSQGPELLTDESVALTQGQSAWFLKSEPQGASLNSPRFHQQDLLGQPPGCGSNPFASHHPRDPLHPSPDRTPHAAPGFQSVLLLMLSDLPKHKSLLQESFHAARCSQDEVQIPTNFSSLNFCPQHPISLCCSHASLLSVPEKCKALSDTQAFVQAVPPV